MSGSGTMLFEEVSTIRHGQHAVLALFEHLALGGDFRNKRIILVDRDYPDDWHRNVYEDIDQETPDAERMVLLTMYPEYSQSASRGDTGSGLVVLTHKQAIADIRKMLSLGYEMTSISREREEIE
jgi:hypothetical protein